MAISPSLGFFKPLNRASNRSTFSGSQTLTPTTRLRSLSRATKKLPIVPETDERILSKRPSTSHLVRAAAMLCLAGLAALPVFFAAPLVIFLSASSDAEPESVVSDDFFSNERSESNRPILISRSNRSPEQFRSSIALG